MLKEFPVTRLKIGTGNGLLYALNEPTYTLRILNPANGQLLDAFQRNSVQIDLPTFTGPTATYQVVRDGKTIEVAQAGLWNFHGLGHWLGMNVHDVGNYSAPLKPGMVFTNEPGIYIREAALENLPKTPENAAFIEKVRPVVQKYRNIGVRIEDSFLLTEGGLERLSAGVPRTIEEVERFLSGSR